jgi:glutathione synthase/RimK-type ligase-like ATP-grasp enzyme
MDVRLVTWAGAGPSGDYDSLPLLAALRQRGINAAISSWTDPRVDWSDAVITVIRSTWDYHEDRARFLEWTERTAAVTQLFNSPDIVHWNSDKRYLLDLERSGIRIVPTLAAAAVEHAVSAILATGWTDVVVKPAISLDGHGVRRTPADADSIRSVLASIEDTGPIIAQPFMRRITDHGEFSLAFIEGRLSHVVRKLPAPGDFRVQERLGGTVHAARAPDGSIEFAQAVLDTLDEAPLYARVDIIEADDTAAGFLLTELELVEPSLFLDTHPPAAGTFADAIAARLRARR